MKVYTGPRKTDIDGRSKNLVEFINEYPIPKSSKFFMGTLHVFITSSGTSTSTIMKIPTRPCPLANR